MILAKAVIVVKVRRRIFDMMGVKLQNRLDDTLDGNVFPSLSTTRLLFSANGIQLI
jgi:hypothetical protein